MRNTPFRVIFNRGAVMLLPSGINKAIGAQRALQELGRSERNLIAFGEAENDLPLLAISEIGAVARAPLRSRRSPRPPRTAHPPWE